MINVCGLHLSGSFDKLNAELKMLKNNGGLNNMKRVSVFLADGFEEIEGLTVVDILRRAGAEVDTVSVTGNLVVHGAHQIDVKADALFEDMDFEGTDMLILPGGMPGTLNLGKHEGLTGLLRIQNEKGAYIAAICAAPSVLGGLGLLNGRKACCYPSFEEKLEGADVVYEPVVQDGHIITSRGMGTAIPFSLKLAELLCGAAKAEQVGKGILFLLPSI